MAKRGRKPGAERTGYFYEEEEKAFVDFLNSTDQDERDKIFREKLYIPFTKMIESLIRGGRYVGGKRALHVPNETFDETFCDAYSFLVDKMGTFDPTKGFKAFSYTQTIVKNYLILKRNKFNKNQQVFSSYEDVSYDLEDSNRYAYDIDGIGNLQTEVIKKSSAMIEQMISKTGTDELNPNEKKVGMAILKLLTEWEDLFQKTGSNKFNKNAILLFIKETTMLSAKEIRESMTKFKSLYFNIKTSLIND